MREYLITIFLSILPISELRGAIPYAMLNEIPFYMAYIIAVIANSLVAPIVYIFLNSIHKLFYKLGWYKKNFDKFVLKAQNKIHPKVEKYGYWGIMIFVAIPLPITGAWTGTLGSWILGLSKRKTIFAVILGVIISGIIVTSVMLIGSESFNFFIKKINL